MNHLRLFIRRLTGPVVVTFCAAFGAAAIIAAPSPQVQGAGGGVAAQSANRRVSGTLGQLASGPAQSATSRVRAGFWGASAACDCPYIGDLDTNGVIDVIDVVGMVNIAFRNAPMAPGDPFCPSFSRANVNCDGVVDVLDVVTFVNAAFRNDDERCDPCEN